MVTATASHRRAAQSRLVMWVRCHCQPARLVILKPCSIHARNPSTGRTGLGRQIGQDQPWIFVAVPPSRPAGCSAAGGDVL